jgi:hypothetical protein
VIVRELFVRVRDAEAIERAVHTAGTEMQEALIAIAAIEIDRSPRT